MEVLSRDVVRKPRPAEGPFETAGAPCAWDVRRQREASADSARPAPTHGAGKPELRTWPREWEGLDADEGPA